LIPSNLPVFRQQALKPLPRTARARIVAAEPFQQLDLSAFHAAQAALDAGLAREALAAFGGALESRAGRVR